MGKELKNNKEDSAKTLVSILNFLDPAFQLGNRQGDEKLFDEEGNYKIPKEEVISEPETDEPNEEERERDSENEPDEWEDAKVMFKGIPQKTKDFNRILKRNAF